jgi:hypothetical protein
LDEKYTTCDSILFCQIYYYRWKRRQLEAHSGFDSRMREEQDPLLTSENHRVDDVVPAWLLVVRYFGALAFVVVVGVAAWWVADNDEKSDFIKPDQGLEWWIIQLLGWSSALLFVRVYFYLSGSFDLISFPLQLGARIPQIC